MKNLTSLFLTLSFLIISVTTLAQRTNDTITIYINNKIEMMVSVKDFDQLKNYDEIQNKLVTFQSAFKSVSEQENGLIKEVAEVLTYFPNKEIIVEKAVRKNIYLLQENEAINTGFRDIAILNFEKINFRISAQDLSDINSINLSKIYLLMVDSLPEKIRVHQKLFYQSKNGAITYLSEKTVSDLAQDFLSLNFDAGANLIKNKWVGDFELKLGLSFKRKRDIRSTYYIAAELLYDFPSLNRTNINTFFTAGYQGTYNEDEDPTSVSFEYGYLVAKQGDFFESGTSRIGIKWTKASAISISPYLYLTKGFKAAFPGVRIGIGF